MLRRHKKNGQTMIEFVALIMFIMATFLVFQKYLMRGFSGRWKQVGEQLGQGRIYDPNLTIECAYDPLYTNSWYNRTCYDDNCDDECLKTLATPPLCTNCINSCLTVYCD